MYKSLFVLCICLLGLAVGRPKEQLIFSDDFDEFDLSVWQHEITASGGGNWEFEYYTNNRSNSYVRNSTLFIRPTLTSDYIGGAENLNSYDLNLWGAAPADVCTSNAFYGCERTGGAGGNILSPIQSARIRTVLSFNFKYGRMEVRAKMPTGDWLWPAIWLLPTYNSYGEWPASGEIDVCESRGNPASYAPGGVNQFGSTLHWGPTGTTDMWPLTHQTYTIPQGDLSQDFHIYGLVWNENEIATYIDDISNVVLNVSLGGKSFWQAGKFDQTTYDNPWAGRGNNAPFDQKFYVIFNVAVGGTGGYFPDGNGKPWSDEDPHAVNSFWAAQDQWYPTWDGENAALQIDSINVWQ